MELPETRSRRDAGGVFELPVTFALGAELTEEFACGVELDDAAVALVGDQEVTFGVEGDPARAGDLPFAGAFARYLAEVFAFDAVVADAAGGAF